MYTQSYLNFVHIAASVLDNTAQDITGLSILCIFTVFLFGMCLIVSSLCFRYQNCPNCCRFPCKRKKFEQVGDDEEAEMRDPKVLEIEPEM